MLLAIDIGNTTISSAVVKNGRVLKVYSVETSLNYKELKMRLNRQLKEIKKKFSAVEDAVLCSVVPKASRPVASVVSDFLKFDPIIVGHDIEVPIKNKYYHPKQVGQDRLVCAYAAKILYGAPAIIIDFGTAITFDVVSAKGEYEGGVIVPGIRLSTESLFKKTALLPQVDRIRAPRSLVGKDTKESILSGIFYGYGAMCRGLIDMISRSVKGSPKVIVTGGHTELMKKFIAQKIYKVDQHLAFKGMYLLYHHAAL